MRDLHIRCQSGDKDILQFTTNVTGVTGISSIHVIIRNREGASVLWMSRSQVHRLAQWLNETLDNSTIEPEII